MRPFEIAVALLSPAFYVTGRMAKGSALARNGPGKSSADFPGPEQRRA
jgi:hypothetical protein